MKKNSTKECFGFTPTPNGGGHGGQFKKSTPVMVWGFTLIEMMVALGLFSIIVAIATGGFIRALRTEKQSVAFMSVNSNLSTVLEQMAREIRTGSDFNRDVSGSLSFRSAGSTEIIYCLQEGMIMRGAGTNCASGQKVTRDNVSVQYLSFVISGNEGGDGLPPRVTILVGAKPKDQSASVYTLNLQTTVSSRIIGS